MIAFIREVFGFGTITLFKIGNFNGVIQIPGLANKPIAVIGGSAGALLVMGLLKAFFNWLGEKKQAQR